MFKCKSNNEEENHVLSRYCFLNSDDIGIRSEFFPPGLSLANMSLKTAILISGEVLVADQLAEMALGLRPLFNFRELLAVINS